jgi:SAM-dependent methyltransferase
VSESADAFTIPGFHELARFQPERRLLWYDYADLWLQYPLGKVLDYGCGDGSFLHRISDRCEEQWGVDVDVEKMGRAKNPAIRMRELRPDGTLPFPDESFDTVTLMEVIEHVANERLVLSEIARVLRLGGRLLLTTPHAGLLTFLDPGNVKFIVPGIHRFIHHVLLRQGDFYEKTFGASRRNRGMVADFTTDQHPWHRHYSLLQIRKLAPSSLNVVAWAVYFPGFRALWSFKLALKVITRGRRHELPRPLKKLDSRLSRCKNRMGDQLIVLFEKSA